MENYYKILGVSENASIEEIKMKYASLKERFNPSHSSGSQFLKEMTLLIDEAYNVLKDDSSRQLYDYKVLGKELPKTAKAEDYIHYFNCDKTEVKNNEEVLFKWKVAEKAIVRIEPFGGVYDVEGEGEFKVERKEAEESATIRLVAIDLETEVVVEKVIELKFIEDTFNVQTVNEEESLSYSKYNVEKIDSSIQKGLRLGRLEYFYFTIMLYIVYFLFSLLLFNALSYKDDAFFFFISILGIPFLSILFYLTVKRIRDFSGSPWLVFYG